MNATQVSLFSLYQQITEVLDYPQSFTVDDSLWKKVSIDELSGLIAQTDSETDMLGFLEECDRIEQAMESLGIEI